MQLDQVLGLTAGTVNRLVNMLGRSALETGDDKPDIEPLRCRLDPGAQLELFADRTSCHKWWPNQFRLLLAGLAYSLLTAVRRLGLRGTGWPALRLAPSASSC